MLCDAKIFEYYITPNNLIINCRLYIFNILILILLFLNGLILITKMEKSYLDGSLCDATHTYFH